MSTEQNYVGRGTNATPIEQTAKQATSVAQINPNSLSEAVKGLEAANLDLYGLVTDYLAVHSASTSADLIQKLLYDWIIEADFSDKINRKELTSAFALISFLTELTEKVYRVEYFTDLVNEKKEVSHAV